jgi:hypothetical protein
VTKFTVGQKLFVVRPGYRRDLPPETFDVTITKVGIKYLTVHRDGAGDWYTYQFRKEDLREKGDYQPQRAYLDRAAWEAEIKREKAWTEFKNSFRVYAYAQYPPDFLSLDEIEQMTAFFTPIRPES